LTQFLKNMVLVVGSVVLFVLALEIFLRMTGLQPDFFYQLDPDISATFLPNKQGWHVFGTNQSRRQWVEINSYGYRDREWPIEKDAGTFRVALLGDSYIAGIEVALEHRISGLLENHLNQVAPPDRLYEVMNFGVVGYGTAQELETFRRRVLQFGPDMAILFVYLGNDLYNNSRELDPEPNKLHYTLDDSGNLVRLPFTISDNFFKQWLRHHSKAYLFVRDRIKTVQAVNRVLVTWGLMQDTIPPGYEGKEQASNLFQHSQYLLETASTIETAWQITEALIGEIQRLALKNSIPFGLVIVPTKEEILNVAPSTLEISRVDMQKSIKRMDEICQTLEANCLQLVGEFRDREVSVEEYFIVDEGHWTEKGHAIAAQAVFDWLGESLSLVSSVAEKDVF